ncbi:MAG TPA: gluconokinase [Nitrospiraceae bacterium]|nr:gluconokinase [Nitrospiraceae bacterium]
MIIIVMGVSGSGKTTIGTQLADALHWDFVDADQFHSAANIEKMRRGVPLTEEDRRPWLSALRSEIAEWLKRDRPVVLACSALKAWYRDELLLDPSRMRIVYLKGSYDVIEKRLLGRHGHFMSRELLASQFAALEEPDDALIVDAARRPSDLVQEIRKGLHL